MCLSVEMGGKCRAYDPNFDTGGPDAGLAGVENPLVMLAKQRSPLTGFQPVARQYKPLVRGNFSTTPWSVPPPLYLRHLLWNSSL